ncbi:MAG: hypothetical protein ABJN65_13030 [Parasphingorhabdus sp.]
MFAALYFLVLPGVIGWAILKPWNNPKPWVSMILIVISAALPILFVFWTTSRADAISSAAYYYVAPGLFIFALISAGFGVSRNLTKK